MSDGLKLFLRVSIGLGILLALCWTLDLRAVAASLAAVEIVWFACLCALAVLIKLLKGAKWWLLLRARAVPLSLWQAARLYFAANLAGALTPAGFGSDIYRTAALHSLRQSDDVISTLLIERLIGYGVLAATAVVCLPFSAVFLHPAVFSALWKILAAGSIFICALAGLFATRPLRRLAKRLLSHFKVTERLGKLWSAFSSFRAHPVLLGLFTALTGLEILLLVLVSYCAARALGIHAPFLYMLAVVPLMQFLIRLPISFQALGIQEGLYVYILVAMGFSRSDGLAVSLLLRIVEVLLVFLPGFILMGSGWRPRTTQHQPK